MAEEAVVESGVILIQHEKYNTQKYNTHVKRDIELSQTKQ